ncbi:MAG TPA: hypothetical protein VFI46_10120 [Jiangellaceae bacterium]|nr:hypothetical protein [Jiangellaceae bacterium]
MERIDVRVDVVGPRQRRPIHLAARPGHVAVDGGPDLELELAHLVLFRVVALLVVW